MLVLILLLGFLDHLLKGMAPLLVKFPSLAILPPQVAADKVLSYFWHLYFDVMFCYLC